MYASAFFLNGLNFNIGHNTKQISRDDKNNHVSQLFMNELNANTTKILKHRHLPVKVNDLKPFYFDSGFWKGIKPGITPGNRDQSPEPNFVCGICLNIC